MSVYVVKAQNLDVVKIGYASRIKSRLWNLRTASPVFLELVALIPGDRCAEAALHARFAEQRLHGEWFNLCPGIEALIAAFPCKYEKSKSQFALSRRGNGRSEKNRDLPKGVSRWRRRFKATISIGGQRKSLGCFATAQEAGEAYQAAVADCAKPPAALNSPIDVFPPFHGEQYA